MNATRGYGSRRICPDREVRQPRKTDLFENAWHLAQQINRLAIGFAQFDAKRMQREHCPVGEPAAADGVGGFAWVLDNCF